jgi:hypothetical protein
MLARFNLFSAFFAQRSITTGTEKLCLTLRVVFTLHLHSSSVDGGGIYREK